MRLPCTEISEGSTPSRSTIYAGLAAILRIYSNLASMARDRLLFGLLAERTIALRCKRSLNGTVVRIHHNPPFYGNVAQLVELAFDVCLVVGSTPAVTTTLRK
jgi:hypothetical protein